MSIKNIHFLTPNTDQGNFHDLYEKVVDYSDWNTKIYLGTKNFCRFCGEINPDKFRNNTSHTFPELSGNKWLFSNDECKKCNAIFSLYETSLGNQSHLMRSIMGISGKNGVPTFKSNDKTIRLENENGEVVMRFENDFSKNADNERLIETIKLNKSFNITFQNKPYVPLFLFKSLSKIAFSIMPQNEIKDDLFDKFTLWLRTKFSTYTNNDDLPFYYVYYNSLKHYTQSPALLLYKLKRYNPEKPMPTFSFIFKHGLLVYQIFLPYYSLDERILKNDSIFLPVSIAVLRFDSNMKTVFKTLRCDSIEKSKTNHSSFRVYRH